MKISIPGLPGVSYNTDVRSTALSVVLTAAGRRAPKPQGYALQALPQLLSLEMDLNAVPADHPFHHLHPTGAQSLEARAREQGQGPVLETVGRELDRALLLAWAVDTETNAALDRLLGHVSEFDVSEDEALDSPAHEFDLEGPIVIDVEDELSSEDRGDPRHFEPDDLGSEE